MTSVGDIATAIQYGFTESATNIPVGPRFLRITDIQNGHVDWNKVPYCKCPEFEKYQLKENDIVFARTGATTGKSFIINECPDAVFASYLIRLRVKENVLARYVYFFFQSKNYWNQINQGVTGSTQGGFNASKLAELQMPILSVEEQRRIVKQLDEIDIALKKRKAANALADQFLQSTFLSMFGDPIENSKGWHKQQIRTLTHSIISGKSVQSEQRKKVNGELGVLKVSAVTYGYFKPEEHKAITNSFVPDESIKPKKGDVLFSRANTKELVAATCIVDKDYDDLFLPDKLWKINLDLKKVDPVFFKYVLSHPSFRNKLSEKATGTSGSMFNISKEKLCEFDFPIPPLFLQQKFASIVADTEQLRKKQKQSEIELENLFQALLQKYFG